MGFCELTGKTILVTGASSGIGRQAAISIAKQGGTVVITGRNEERLEETMQALKGNNHQLIVADLTKDKDVDMLVEALPQLNGIVHSAGIVAAMPVKFIRQENISKMTRINYEVPVFLTARVLLKKKILNNASIVFMSTISTQLPFFGGSLYTSAKAAIESYSKALALEMVTRGIRSNTLAPGLVKTPLITEPASDGQIQMIDDSLERYLKKFPMGVGEPVDVANAIVFFLSDESKWISGSNLIMGGVLQ